MLSFRSFISKGGSILSRSNAIIRCLSALIVFSSQKTGLIPSQNHDLSALATECSDHAPLLLKTECSLPHFKRFCFENFWLKREGYLQVVEEAWNAPLPWSYTDVDAFRCVGFKLCNTAEALKSWSTKQIRSVHTTCNCEGDHIPTGGGTRFQYSSTT